ncbi:cyclin-dependent kinase A-1-like isoform X2 [Diospyros lotus]|uniref:cyclin-dependent kinase A-1-like isoform X2 n=1 Tax=Diospyros lotus TaxID=55363 RepID=UPI0022548E16|nr:cyclin-dependent kinase A-1-like isoform X2 [Diospyros lotus]
MDKYEVFRFIGTVGGCRLLKARHRSSGDLVTLKEVSINLSQEGVPSSLIREISFLIELDHKNIVKLFDVGNIGRRVYLVLEYLPHDLKSFLFSNFFLYLGRTLMKGLLYQLLKGVAYCHSHKTIHRDLTCENLLVDERGKILKITNFGSARAIDVPFKTYTGGSQVTTLVYRAPELLRGDSKYSTAVDMWSVGCIFAEMVRKQTLFSATTEEVLLIQIFSLLGTPDEEIWPDINELCKRLRAYAENQAKTLNKSIPPLLETFDKSEPKELSKYVKGLEESGVDLLSMLRVNPRTRITASEALKHPYFRDKDMKPVLRF